MEKIKNILITGCGGMLGSGVYPYLESQGYNVMATDLVVNETWLSKLDVREFNEAKSIAQEFKPDIILHLAAFTSLEYSEEHVDALEKLHAVVKAHLFLSEAAREWFFFAFMEARNMDRKAIVELQAMESYTEEILVDILKQGEKDGVFLKRDHLMTASIIKAMQQDWYLKRWKYALRKISVDKYAEHIMEFIESYCVST